MRKYPLGPWSRWAPLPVGDCRTWLQANVLLQISCKTNQLCSGWGLSMSVQRCEGASMFSCFCLHLQGGTRHWNWAEDIRGEIHSAELRGGICPIPSPPVLLSAHVTSDRRADEIRAASVVSGSKVNFIKSKAPLTAISRKESKALFITGISIEAFVWPPYRLSPPHPHWLQIRDGRRALIK